MRNAERYLGVNPLVAPPWRYLAQASGELGNTPAAIAAWRTLLQLDAPDPAGAHFQLAQLLRKNGETAEARSQTLLALEEAPRFREALKVLLELNRAGSEGTPGGAVVVPQPAAPTPAPGTDGTRKQ